MVVLLKTQLFSLSSREDEAHILSRLVEIVGDGGVIVFPTDTVYGIGGDPLNKETIHRVFAIKDRHFEKALPVLIDCIETLAKYVDHPPHLSRILEQVWPGPITLVFKKNPIVPADLTGGRDSIAIRIPNHPFLLKLLSAVGGALIGTSANISGVSPLSSKEDILAWFDGKVEAILLQPTPLLGVPSAVVDLTGKTPTILRKGSTDLSWLQKILASSL